MKKFFKIYLKVFLFLLLISFSTSCEKESLELNDEISQDQIDEESLELKQSGAQWLNKQQKRGGHTMTRHWNKSRKWLKNRIRTQGVPVASSFVNQNKNKIGKKIRYQLGRATQNRGYTFNPGLGDLGTCIGRRPNGRFNIITNPRNIRFVVREAGTPNKFLLTAFPVQ